TELDRGLIGDLMNNDVKFDVKNPEPPSFLAQIFISWFPMLLLIGVWIFFMKKSQGKGGMGGMLSVGKSKARMLDEKSN
ncbi:cell division protein FtsH, partial [Escherichia coli]